MMSTSVGFGYGIIVPRLYIEFDFFHQGAHCKLIERYGEGFLFNIFCSKVLLYKYAYIFNKVKDVFLFIIII